MKTKLLILLSLIFLSADSAIAQAPASQERQQQEANRKQISDLTIPDIDDLPRVGRGTKVSQQARKYSAWIMKTRPHAVAGDKYVILTDHKDAAWLKPLGRLAKHRRGVVVKVEDLASLHQNADSMNKVRLRLKKENVRFLAIAPRVDSFRENMLLGVWELLATLDEDPQLDAFPGVLYASNAASFSNLIDQSINHVPQPADDIRPFGICLVSPRLRSLQKTGILRNMFAKSGLAMPSIGIYSAKSKSAPDLPGKDFLRYQLENQGRFLKQIPADVSAVFSDASLLIMHGHGSPGMACGADIDLIQGNVSNKIIFLGSCFSTFPQHSDLVAMREAPGGLKVDERDAFAIRAIDQGALAVYGHMRLSNGFRQLYPTLESMLAGQSLGEAYQQLINGLIERDNYKTGEFVVAGEGLKVRKPRQNSLLHVIIGDPALQPFAASH
jgi:hypothetical protein